MAEYKIENDTVYEGVKRLKIKNKADVVVAGGGPSGLIAAIAAARAGANTILIERATFLGGVATSGMMAALVSAQNATGIGLELVNKMAERGGATTKSSNNLISTIPFDPEVFKDVSLEMVVEAGVNLILHTMVTDPIVINEEVKGVIIESKSGREAILGKVIIDCTGDADLAFAAGAPCMIGRESDNKMRPISLLFRVGGLDIEKMIQYMKNNSEDMQPQHQTGTRLKAGNEDVITRISGFYSLVEKAKKEGELYPECHYFRFENLWVDRHTAICNTTRVYNVDGTKNDDLTRAEITARKQIKKLMDFARKYIPGCENAFLIDVAPHLGVRETRRIKGEYSLTDEDAYNDKQFEDAILTKESNLVKRPIPEHLDVHMPDPIEGSDKDWLERNPEKVPREKHCFQLPYRILIPKLVDNLLVAGRSISVSHMLDSMTRNMLICMHMGQVAGVAAAISANSNLSPKKINLDKVKEILKRQNMYI